jgi:serralysin
MSYHLYDIDELFTNADGSIQFIELSMPDGGGPGENAWGGHYIVSTNGVSTNSFLTTNLPSSATTGTHVLLATAGFQAATGVTPDFVIPNGFLFASNGTVSWGSMTSGISDGSTVDTVNYTSLPKNGHTSLNFDINLGDAQSNGEGSPTDFAGVTGALSFINGTASNDTTTGTTKSDLIQGLGGNDTLNGVGANDTLVGAGGADSLLGGDGADVLQGGGLSDKLKGGAGNDRFVFNEAASGDVIQDFNGNGDKVQLENSVFTGLAVGAVPAGKLQIGVDAAISATSGDANDLLKYETDTGHLYYDANGNGAGGLQLIATIHLVAGAFNAADITVT